MTTIIVVTKLLKGYLRNYRENCRCGDLKHARIRTEEYIGNGRWSCGSRIDNERKCDKSVMPGIIYYVV